MAAEGYDDGRTDVPGGVTGAVERVVVVGAGIAGLTVVNALGHGGVERVVLEARQRIGGRLHTVDLAGSPVDMGGSWIHHRWACSSGGPESRSAVACCLPENTLRAPAWPTPTVQLGPILHTVG